MSQPSSTVSIDRITEIIPSRKVSPMWYLKVSPIYVSATSKYNDQPTQPFIGRYSVEIISILMGRSVPNYLT